MNIRIVAIIVGVAVVSSVAAFMLTLPQQNEAVHNNAGMLGNGKDTSNVVTSLVEYYDGTMGFLARPDGVGKYPGIVMIHEWWGLNDNIKDMARQMAAEGYVVLAVDLYNEVATESTRARELASNVRNNPDKAIENMHSAVSFLREHDSVRSDRIASLGWCFGGGMSLQLALNEPNMAATGIYYGSLVMDKERLSVIGWPVLGIFGSADTSIPVEQVREFEKVLMENNVESEIYIYDGVGHAFANPSGENYAPEETKDAWHKTVAFFDKHLK